MDALQALANPSQPAAATTVADAGPEPPAGPPPDQTQDSEPAAPKGRRPEKPLDTAADFRRWYEEAAAGHVQRQMRRTARHEAALKRELARLDAALGALGAAGRRLGELREGGRRVRGRTRQLQSQCQGLAREREAAEGLAAALRERLQGFDDLALAGSLLAQAAKLDGAPRRQALREAFDALDRCEAAAEAGQLYADAPQFASRLRALQARSLALARQEAQRLLGAAAAAGDGSAGGAAPPATDGEPPPHPGAALGKWRAGLGGWRELVELVGARAKRRKDCAEAVRDLAGLYGGARAQEVAPGVQAELLGLADAGLPLAELARRGLAQVARVAAREVDAAQALFPRDLADAGTEAAAGGAAGAAPGGIGLGALRTLLDPLCTALFDVLRPQYLLIRDVGALADLVETLEGTLAAEGGDRAVGVVQPFVAGILADVRSRLTYRAQAFIRDEIALYAPSAEDLDYPAKLEPPAEEGAAAEAGEEGGAAGGSSESDTDFRAWFPPLQQTLVLLAKLYRSLDGKTFGGLAQEAIKVCVEQVAAASAKIAKRAGPTDGHLFLVKHLLVLREQIAQFDTDFGVTETELDFTHMRDHVRKIMLGESSVFSLGASNVVLQLISSGRPRVHQLHLDSKKELEKQLKAACETFIISVTKTTVEPMLGFITKVTAMQVTGTRQPLREHAFASPAKIAGILAQVNEAVETVLPAAAAKLKVYLPNPRTRAILFKPIKSNISEAHAQIAALLEREYTAEDREGLGLKGAGELRGVLEAFSE